MQPNAKTEGGKKTQLQAAEQWCDGVGELQ